MTDTTQPIAFPWYLSRTVWATITTSVLGFANSVGYHADPAWAKSLPDILLNAATLASLVLTAYLHMKSKNSSAVAVPVPVIVPAAVIVTPAQGTSP